MTKGISDEILRSVLPDELLDGKPAGFAQVGHIGRCLFTFPAVLPYQANFSYSPPQFEGAISPLQIFDWTSHPGREPVALLEQCGLSFMQVEEQECEDSCE